MKITLNFKGLLTDGVTSFVGIVTLRIQFCVKGANFWEVMMVILYQTVFERINSD